jgi:integrase
MQIWKEYNAILKRHQWRARFRCNNKQFRVKKDTKDELLDLIAEIRRQESQEKANKKFGLKVEIVSYFPTAAELFEKVLPTIPNHNHRTMSERVFNNFLELLPALIKVNEIKKHHFQIYINFRAGQLGKQSKQPIRPQTIFKELYAISSALKQGAVYFDSLEDWQTPGLPELPKNVKKKPRRERLVTNFELESIIKALSKPPTGKQTQAHFFHRIRLTHQIEFQYWTGLRRKEIASLKFSQFDKNQQALLNVKRWKTDSVTKFFPLSKRAVEIIELRRELQKDCEFIFTPDGQPIEANYRTLKRVCEKLKIPYGAFTDGGFVTHDLRHNFGTEILRETDVETARILLRHSNISQTGTYAHTSNDRLKEAVRKRDKIDYEGELKNFFKLVENGQITEPDFIKEIKKLFGF